MKILQFFKIKIKQISFRTILILKFILYNSKIFNFFINYSLKTKSKNNYDEYIYIKSFKARAKQIIYLLNKLDKKIIIYLYPEIKLNLNNSKNIKIIRFKNKLEFNKHFIQNGFKKHLFVNDILDCSFLVAHSKLVILHLRDIYKGRNIDKFLNFYELHFLKKTYKILLRDERIPKIHGQLKNISKNIIYDFVYENHQKNVKKTKIPKIVISGFVSENLIPTNVIKKLIKFNCDICFLVDENSKNRVINIVKKLVISDKKQIYFKNYLHDNDYYNFLKKFDVGLCTYYNKIKKDMYSKKFTNYGSSTKLADYISVGLLPIIGNDYKLQQKICVDSNVKHLTDKIFINLNLRKFLNIINAYKKTNSKKILNKHKIILNEFLNKY